LKLQKLEWRNIGPFGNKEQTIELPDGGGLWMVVGKNGNGKCLSKKTKLLVSIKDEQLKEEFLKFLKK
jgi:hypothetical protein